MQPSVREPVTVCVALGANLGDARQAVLHAFEALNNLPGTRLTARSRLYRSAPHEAQGPDFVECGGATGHDIERAWFAGCSASAGSRGRP
jgi:hypothetical protein